jgi:hypothetical protein
MRRTLLFSLIIFCFVNRNGYAQNIDISGGLVFEGEPYMAIDPANPQHIVVAWMGTVPFVHTSIKIKTTFDGGATWSAAAALPHQSPTFGSADVSMAFDHSGNVFATYIDFRQSPDSGAVYIVKSVDGGLTWGAASQVISGFADGAKYPLDRPWLTIRRCSGSTPDTLYVTTKPAPWVAAPNRPYFVKSYDYGSTWSTWRYIDSTGYLVGNTIKQPMATPAVDSGGTFHCLYPTYLVSTSIYPRYIMATAGPANSFSYNVAYTVVGGTAPDTLAKAGEKLVCDPTNNAHYIFLCIENLHGDLDVFSIETLNGGITWGSPVRVNDDAVSNGKMQDLVWANFDEYGDLIAAWRDRRNAAGTGYQQPSEIWGAIKWKDSVNFSANFKISDTAAPYDSVYLAGPGNDFMNVAMAQDTMSAVWGDVRTGVLNIWFERRAMRTGVTTIIKSIVNEKIPEVNIYPNPVSKYLTVEGDGIINLTLCDLSGRQVLQKPISSSKTVLDVSGVTVGVYVVVVNTENGKVSKMVEIQ